MMPGQLLCAIRADLTVVYAFNRLGGEEGTSTRLRILDIEDSIVGVRPMWQHARQISMEKAATSAAASRQVPKASTVMS
jgi:hypothetical protein